MTKRAFAGLLAAGLMIGVAACGKSIDKEGSVANLVKPGSSHDQAEWIVDGVDHEFGGNDKVIGELTKAQPNLSQQDQQTLIGIVTRCATSDTTTG